MNINYPYYVTDTVNDKVNIGSLTQEISDSSIAVALDSINVIENDLEIWFKGDLSVAEEDALTDIVAAHKGEPLPDVITVHSDAATLQCPDSEVPRVVVQPARTGYYICDRDILVKTAIYEGADSFEDLKVNVSDNKQVAWGEFSHVGCYKLDSLDYVACIDQADADANACLSVFDYLAVNQNTNDEIEYDFKGGCLWSDGALEAPLWEHRLYAVMAPNIPSSMGGGVRFFDGYLYPYQGKWQECINSLALTIDPSQTVEAARVRFWIYYPSGAKQNHVLRLITYRKPNTF